MTLRLGVIGMSEGNGHPYSWSAIFNGYDPVAMRDCGFPVIPEYLARQRWPEARIADAKVTQVWTQSLDLSRCLAAAALIPGISKSPHDMIGEVDAVLLARDDAENHFEFAAPFLEAGLPIYIDKPVALSLHDLQRLYERERYPGQIFTCSAMRYDPDLKPTVADWAAIGEPRLVHAITPKSWDKYAVHIIEPVLEMLGADWSVERIDALPAPDGGGFLQVLTSRGTTLRFAAAGAYAAAPLAIRVVGIRGWKEYAFSNVFVAFKAALQDFVDGARTRGVRSPRSYNERVVALIEAGRCHE